MHELTRVVDAAAEFVASIPTIKARQPHLAAVVADPSGALSLVRVLGTLPRVELHLSQDACCAGLRRRLCRRTLGVRTELLAPAVLELPPTLAAYLTGRSRQAVRTALHRAERAGMQVMTVDAAERTAVLAEMEARRTNYGINEDDWAAVLEPATHWVTARNSAGDLLALGVVLACRHGARLELHIGARDAEGDDVSSARYLVHTEAVRHAIGAGSPMLIVDSPLGLSAGLRHFQARLGYSARRLRLTTA